MEKSFFIVRNGKTIEVGKYEYLVHLLESINSLQFEFESIVVDEGDLTEEQIDEVNSLVQQLDGITEK